MAAYCEHLPHLELTAFTAPGLVRYEPGDFFVSHVDAGTGQKRTVSAIALLPSAFTGGELCFFDQQDPFPLRPGDVVLFPSNFLFPHAVQPVISGTRHSVVTWMY